MEKKRNSIILSVFGVVFVVMLILLLNANSKNNELERTVQAQTATINELKNGTERRIDEIRALFKNKQFKELYSVTAELSQNHPGSKEANEAEGYVSQAQAEEAAILAKQKAEAQRQKELAERSSVDKARSIIRVSRVFTDNPNSAGGVDFHVIWQNTTVKTIKYIVFTVVPYNSVNDAVMCTIRHESEYRGQVTGPIAPGQWYGKNYQWECAWYNNTIVRAELKQIDIQYMDGTTEQLSGQDVKYVQY